MPNPIKAVKAVKAAKKAAERAKTNKIQKNSVKVKPAAKQKPNRPNQAKVNYKSDTSYNRAYNKFIKEYKSMPEVGKFGSAAEMEAEAIDAMGLLGLSRKANIVKKKIRQTNARKATTPTNRTVNPFDFKETIKINSSISKRRSK